MNGILLLSIGVLLGYFASDLFPSLCSELADTHPRSRGHLLLRTDSIEERSPKNRIFPPLKG